MRRTILSLFALVLLTLAASPTFATDSDASGIEQAVVHGYIEGIWTEADEAKVRTHFHPSFIMHALRDGEMVNVSLDAWLERLNLSGEGRPDIRYELRILSHTGSAATVQVELYQGDRHRFTDYLSLYHFEDGWKIVGKIFHSHG